jgi:hypothetical protein
MKRVLPCFKEAGELPKPPCEPQSGGNEVTNYARALDPDLALHLRV